MKNKPKELEEKEYWMKSGIVVDNSEIADQFPNVPRDLSIDDKFDLCVILAMKLKKSKENE